MTRRDWARAAAIAHAALNTALALVTLPLARPTITVDAYREADRTEETWLRIRIRNPFRHPVHIGRLRSIRPPLAAVSKWKVDVDDWELRHVIAHAVTQRLDVFLDAGREMTVAFTPDRLEPQTLIFGLSWHHRRSALLPTLPSPVVRTRKRVEELLADPAEEPSSRKK